MSEANEVYICGSDALVDGGTGVRFPVLAFGDEATGFVVRHGGKVYGYLNRCAHVPVELDWFKGEFFESSKLYLMCSTHGAIYVPETGVCAGGPCRGGKLRRSRCANPKRASTGSRTSISSRLSKTSKYL
jgi:nitrite reductase/ring-hydroxylating ferredoxin subunit